MTFMVGFCSRKSIAGKRLSMAVNGERPTIVIAGGGQ
jgi:hypothetical protein